MADTDPFAMNVAGATDLIASPTNKVSGSDQALIEGLAGEKEDALSLDLSDEELIKLARHWNADYAGYKAQIEKKQKANFAYYVGRQWEGTQYASNFPIEGNLIFEAEETFLPAALSKNPDPVVFSDDTPEGNELADDIKTMLQYHAVDLNLRTKLSQMVRQWSIYYLGVLKYGWDTRINDVSIELRKIQDFIFDKDGFVDATGHFNSYLGEQITVTAEKLIELFPDHKAYITGMVEGKLGTKVIYTEWWTDEYCFVTFKDKVLDKHKNEFYKYETDEEEGRNHFAQPKKPYTFLSVFSLSEQPHDITSLIEQNIPNQNLITKRIRQIDKNLSLQNNSVAFSEDNFNQETAKQANQAFEEGNGVLVPEGRPIQEAIVRFPAEGFPDAAFKELESNKQNLRSSFGTEGITAQRPNDNTTARGMILNQQYDNSRIGGGVGDAIERVARANFNWLVQLYHVFYDEKHFAAVMGSMKATEYTVLSAQDINKRLIVTVAPDSMKPRDEITEMNQAMSMWQDGALGLKTFLTLQKLPDPHEAAEDTALWLMDKNVYLQLNFPELAQKIAALQQQQQAAQGAQPQPQGGGGAPVSGAPAPEGGVPANPALSQVPLPQ